MYCACAYQKQGLSNENGHSQAHHLLPAVQRTVSFTFSYSYRKRFEFEINTGYVAMRLLYPVWKETAKIIFVYLEQLNNDN